MLQSRKRLVMMTWIITVSFVLLTSATFAWMSIASSIKVSDLELNIVTENAMEISLDNNGAPGEWTTVLSMGELLSGGAALQPVTWSAEQDSFLAPRYGLDGRIAFADPIEFTKNENGITLPTDPEAEGSDGGGYLIALELWMRTGSSNATVFLSTPTESSEGVMGGGSYLIGEPTWNPGALVHENGGGGAERAMRMGFRFYDEEYDEGGFVIYEPNADGDDIPEDGEGAPPEGGFKTIKQGVSTWTEQTPVLHGSVNYELGEFFGEDTELFKLKSDTPRRFTVYIWLEGEDPDCDNSISGGKLLANLQFGATTGDDREEVERPFDIPTDKTNENNDEIE